MNIKQVIGVIFAGFTVYLLMNGLLAVFSNDGRSAAGLWITFLLFLLFTGLFLSAGAAQETQNARAAGPVRAVRSTRCTVSGGPGGRFRCIREAGHGGEHGFQEAAGPGPGSGPSQTERGVD